MMTAWLRARLPAFAWTCVLCACGPRAALPTPPDTRPGVVSFEPGDELGALDVALRLHFSQPMVAIDAVGPALAQPPLRIEPALPLRVHWEDRQTLLVRPELEWRQAQRYTLTLAPELARQLKPPHAFVFDALPLRVQQLSPSGSNVSRGPRVEVWFNAEVERGEVEKRCSLVGVGGGERAEETEGRGRGKGKGKLKSRSGSGVGVRLLPVRGDEDSRRVVRIEPVGRLAELTTYTLDCPGLQARGGTAPFRRDNEQRFTTHGPLRVLAPFPAQDSALAPERAGLCLQLSTPVDVEQLAAHVHVSPAPEGLAESWREDSCTDEWNDTDRASSIVLPPHQRFTVTIDAQLADRFGQQLGKAYSWSFATGDRLPGLWTNTGRARVFEPSQSGHGAGALNLPAVTFSCAALEPAQLAASFDAIGQWVDEWPGTAQNERAPAPWLALGLAVTPQRIDTSAQANVGRIVPIDLGARCGRKPRAPGLYLTAVEPVGVNGRERQGDVQARMLANVTDLALLAKRGEHTGLVWITRFSSGALVAGATVQAFDDGGNLLASARSDGDGLARFPRLPATRGRTYFSARLGDDVAVVGDQWPWRDGLDAYQLGVREQYDDDSVRLFLHSDRGVYRPGERVLLHGLAREVSDLAPARVPAGAIARVTLQLEPGSVITRELPLSDFGSFASELDLPPHLPPGAYGLDVEVAGKHQGLAISVAEFRPLTFELSGGPAAPELLAPEPVKVAIDARYLFGAPLPDAELRWTVERSPASIEPAAFSEFSFEDSAPALPKEEPLPQAPRGIVLERTARTDAKGHAELEFATAAERGPTRYAITVEAQDSGHDVASRAYSVLAHSADRYPGVRMSKGLFSRGEPVQAEIVLVDRDGHAIAGEVELELRQARWQCPDPERSCRVEVRVLGTQKLSVESGRPTLASFAVEAAGDVHVRALARDPQGRVARASASAWVWSPEGEGPYNDRVAATLTADKRRYQPGEHARLALQTPLAPAHYLLTAERGDVLAAKVVAASAEGKAAAVPELALAPRMAPNVFLTMAATTPRSAAGEAGKPRLVAGAREVQVQSRTRALQVKLVLPRTRFEPKQRVQGEVVVTHLGKPVRAEVALVAVNESVLQLTDFRTPDPGKVFHAPRALGVTTSSNVTALVGDPAAATRIPEVARIERGGADGGGGRPELRDDYVAAAYWAPALRTDARGHAQFAFDAPTDLSAYRLMAVAAALDDRVGSGDARIEVQQPLSVHPLSPRFVSAGDTLELGAVVHDHTGAPGAIAVRWSASGLALAQATSSLPGADPGGKAVYTRATVQPGERASWDVQVSKGNASDRVGRQLSVRRPLERELRVLSQLRATKVKSELVWPRGIDRELSRLEITVDRLGLAPLAPVLAAVLDYPYGCTEQTSAALSAIAATPELAAALVPAFRDRKALDARVADGIGRLQAARNGDGGFGLYPGLPSRAWLASYVLQAALALRDAGFAVPSALLDGARDALASWLAAQQPAKLTVAELENAAEATMMLARAGAAARGDEERIWAQHARLRSEGRAFLLHALALRKLAPERRAQLRASLGEVRKHDRKRDLEDPFASEEHRSAVVLAALHADGGDPAFERDLASWLIARAGDPEVFLSTRDIATVLAALADYARGSSAGATQVELGLGTRKLFSGSLSGTQIIAIDEAARTAGNGELWLRADADVSISFRRRDVSPSSEQPEFSRGLTLVRKYLAPNTGKPLTQVAIGDLVQVELELHTDHAMRMIALADPLPGGFDPVDPGLSTGRIGGCEACNTEGAFNYLRRHDDRIEAFAEWLPAGTQRVRYLLRATTAGTFTAPGATAQPMYLPNLFARSSVGEITIAR